MHTPLVELLCAAAVTAGMGRFLCTFLNTFCVQQKVKKQQVTLNNKKKGEKEKKKGKKTGQRSSLSDLYVYIMSYRYIFIIIFLSARDSRL
jgi:hypothetical protein